MLFHALALLWLASVPAPGAPSNLVISTDGPLLRVSLDGKGYGSFTASQVKIESVSAGRHDLVVSWLDKQHLLRKQTVYQGKLSVTPGTEMRIHAVEQGIQVTDQVPLAAAAEMQPASVPVADFSSGPSVLYLTAEKTMSMVLVDGHSLTQADCDSPKSCTVSGLARGNHSLEVRGGMFAGKVLYRGTVTIPGGAEVFGRVEEGSFQIYNAVARPTEEAASAALPQPGTVASLSLVDPATGEAVGLSVSAGSAQVIPAVPAGPGSIELTSGDGESFQVWMDGKHVAQFMGLSGRSIVVKNVPPGEHTLEVKSFMNDRSWAKGHLYMDPGFGLKMGVTEHQGLEAYNRSSAWEPTE